MEATKEKIVNQKINLRENAVRQGSRINLALFNYCFLVYYYLIKEIEKNAHYASGVLLDVGCGNTPFQEYFLKYIKKYLKHEHPAAAKKNITYDYLSELPALNVPDSSVNTIVSFAVLEHVSEPFETIKEFYRILKTNGIFMIYVPQYWHLHEEPHDYLRFTKYILQEKIREKSFEILYMKGIGKSFAIAGQALCNALVLMFDLNHVKNIFALLKGEKPTGVLNSLIYTICKLPLILLSVLLIPVINLTFLALDLLLGSEKDTIGYFVIARKISN